MSGERAQPFRHFLIDIGGVPLSVQASDFAARPQHGSDIRFALTADFATQTVGDDTHVIVRRLIANNAAITLDAKTVRHFAPTESRDLRGQIEAGLTNLSASGTIELAQNTNRDHLSGNVHFSGFRVCVAGEPKMGFSLDDLSATAQVESNLQPAHGMAVAINRLQVGNVKVAIAADTLRHFVTTLPPEVHGRIESGLANLSATGAIALTHGAVHDHLLGSVAFSGLQLRDTGDRQMTFNLDGLDGAAGIDSNLPLTTEGTITIKRLHVNRFDASIDMDTLRRYGLNLPTNLRGISTADFRALDIAGELKSGVRNARQFDGNLALEDLSARLPADSSSVFELDRFTLTASTTMRLDRWDPASFKVRGGAIRWVRFSYRGNLVNNVEAAWRADGTMLTFDRMAAQVFGGEISGLPQFDLATREIHDFDLRIKSIDAHQALANLSPEHLDADGNASGILHLAMSARGELSGQADLSFDAPGVLRIGQIAELERMLGGNFGAEMANLAMHDLEHYPFKQGTLHLKSAGANSELKINFVRQPRAAGDKTTPHKEMINGHEVWVGSLIVPKIDLTIPIAGKSFAEILSLVSGFHPLIRAVDKQDGK
jgi:hypothetical protein